jgi:hypothetical protein
MYLRYINNLAQRLYKDRRNGKRKKRDKDGTRREEGEMVQEVSRGWIEGGSRGAGGGT